MTAAKLHHYVPQFYLRRFCDAGGRLWAWDKTKDVSFATRPGGVAAETGFYTTDNSDRVDPDPLAMERQLSHLEANVSLITEQWLGWLEEIGPGQPIDLPVVNRNEVSLYIALQYLRTRDTREILAALAEEDGETVSEGRSRHIHRDLLWHDEFVHGLRDHLRDAAWIFGRNESPTPFVTSDNPVAFRTPDNLRWLRVGVRAPGVYAVFPLSPTVVMYLHNRHDRFSSLAKFDRCLSPVKFTPEMVESENSGQVFMATRFVFSIRNVFDFERNFARSIGTNRYAPKSN